MHPLTHIVLPLGVATASATSSSTPLPNNPSCTPFPPSMHSFSYQFQQPQPPLIKSEFNTSFVQHKWNENLTHITTGTITNSPSTLSVLANEAFYNPTEPTGIYLASSLFNYANVTPDGLQVDNTLTTFSTPISGGDPAPVPSIWRGYVVSNYPLFSSDFLVTNSAVFGGLVHDREFQPGAVAIWNVLYLGVIPVTIYMDTCNVVVGYDYFSPNLRTRVVNLFFNTQASSA